MILLEISGFLAVCCGFCLLLSPLPTSPSERSCVWLFCHSEFISESLSGAFGLTPHPSLQPYGTQFHSTHFVSSVQLVSLGEELCLVILSFRTRFGISIRTLCFVKFPLLGRGLGRGVDFLFASVIDSSLCSE